MSTINAADGSLQKVTAIKVPYFKTIKLHFKIKKSYAFGGIE
jgi:hypothetical protein